MSKTYRMLTVMGLLLSVGLIPLMGQGEDGRLPAKDRDRHRIIPPMRILTEYLDFSEEQLADVLSLREEIAATLGPIKEQAQMFGEDLKAELDSEVPDEFTVGAIVIAIHELRQNSAELARGFHQDFLDLMTSEQLELWEALKERFRNEGRQG